MTQAERIRPYLPAAYAALAAWKIQADLLWTGVKILHIATRPLWA